MDKKIYNLKESSLGKINFADGTVFMSISFNADSGEKVNEVIILSSLDEAVRKLPSFVTELTFKHVQDKLKFHNDIVEWLIENWLDPGIVTCQKYIAQQYGFPEFSEMDPIKWIKSEPEMVALTLSHIAGRYTNGYLKLPEKIRNLEFCCRFVKNVLAINFWEENEK
ncbi:hypothetical protein SGLAD_v1c04820 [Spiroplasma gladiatoris]|uniref:Uncharacterized protein n=1 Tax=Spiroplasma gladiatoris TaxID=2143 RepID=A0A4P7AHR5_9MOLU|nr:hypothetical protein [Spiroplasma gladiatoris]QBQ07681.1 hypothetical protein SGLAD_v1c04820 [Spiroplasma gladiatoris]